MNLEPRCLACGKLIPSFKLDFCEQCFHEQWIDGLEKCHMPAGTVVNGLKAGYKDFNALYQVEEDFSGNWPDPVRLRVMGDNGSLSPDVIEKSRDSITYL